MRLWAMAVVLALGCGGTPVPTPAPAAKITWDEFRKMSPEERANPYVVGQLDDDARARLARGTGR